MAFVVEDGTGSVTATSYIDVTYADSYFADRLITAWSSLTNPSKQAALIAATDYIDSVWGSYFKGAQISEAQSLQFPRDAFTGIPETLKKATAEYALRASTSSLAPDVEQDPSGYQVSRKMERVGPIEERTDFAFLGPGSSRKVLKSYPAADMLVRPLLRASNRVIRN